MFFSKLKWIYLNLSIHLNPKFFSKKKVYSNLKKNFFKLREFIWTAKSFLIQNNFCWLYINYFRAKCPIIFKIHKEHFCEKHRNYAIDVLSICMHIYICTLTLWERDSSIKLTTSSIFMKLGIQEFLIMAYLNLKPELTNLKCLIQYSTPRKQFLWIKKTFHLYRIKGKISLNWRKFCWFKKIFFNVNKSIYLDQKIFLN